MKKKDKKPAIKYGDTSKWGVPLNLDPEKYLKSVKEKKEATA